MAKRNKGKKTDLGKEESSVRNYFVRLFGKSGFHSETQFVNFSKRLFFIALATAQALMLLQQIGDFKDSGNVLRLISSLALCGVLLPVSALNLFVLKDRKTRISLYVVQAIAAVGILFFNANTAGIAIYILALTGLYVDAGKTKPVLLLLCAGIPLYFICYVARLYFLQGGVVDFFSVIRESLGVVVTLIAHFIVVQIALTFYRQFLRLDRALKELAESKKELEKAYEAVAEVSALEERQRIAKEIHDTAGHSLTTVIMQTEAAKRILEEDPKQAKSKIVAANLQAKHALDELRDSVHLLSGSMHSETLKTALEDILHESTDGTEIVIRSQVEEIAVSPAKHRFLCNSLKEGISNGLRHGGATAFWFELKKDADKICFLLSDNGKGVQGEWKMGFGLSSMQERAKALGGEVVFESEDGEGFELRLLLPEDN